MWVLLVTSPLVIGLARGLCLLGALRRSRALAEGRTVEFRCTIEESPVHLRADSRHGRLIVVSSYETARLLPLGGELTNHQKLSSGWRGQAFAPWDSVLYRDPTGQTWALNVLRVDHRALSRLLTQKDTWRHTTSKRQRMLSTLPGWLFGTLLVAAIMGAVAIPLRFQAHEVSARVVSVSAGTECTVRWDRVWTAKISCSGTELPGDPIRFYLPPNHFADPGPLGAFERDMCSVIAASAAAVALLGLLVAEPLGRARRSRSAKAALAGKPSSSS